LVLCGGGGAKVGVTGGRVWKEGGWWKDGFLVINLGGVGGGQGETKAGTGNFCRRKGGRKGDIQSGNPGKTGGGERERRLLPWGEGVRRGKHWG